jgi:hypothetical protein
MDSIKMGRGKEGGGDFRGVQAAVRQQQHRERGSERGRIIRQISQSNETKRKRINQIIY